MTTRDGAQPSALPLVQVLAKVALVIAGCEAVSPVDDTAEGEPISNFSDRRRRTSAAAEERQRRRRAA